MSQVAVAFAPSDGSAIERTGKPIWTNLYGMRVPFVETQSGDMLKRAGMLNSGNRLLNRQMHNEVVAVVITINDMVEYFRRGVTLTFQNSLETREVYDIVNNYILAWREQVHNGINLGEVPTEDLMLLDRFAETLHPVAVKFGAAPRNTGSLFTNLLTGNGKFVTRDSFLSKPDTDEQPMQQQRHVSHANPLAKAISELGSGSWIAPMTPSK